MKWGSQQDKTLKDVSNWFNSKDKKQIHRIFGYAGTGKTTLAKHFREQISGNVLYGAYTGKAASVMRAKGCDNATTIHSLIYSPVLDENTGEVSFVYNNNSIIKTAELVIIDECSMVDDNMAEDLLSFNVPILVLGDPGQLPPVNGEGYFTNSTPDNMLTEIHRQALENPIIYLSTKVREGNKLKLGSYGNSLVKNKFNKNEVLAANQVICGKNNTRKNINSAIREIKGFKGKFPNVGETLICLRNKTDKKSGERIYFNGCQYEVTDILGKEDSKSNYKKYIVMSKDTQTKSTAKVLNYTFDKENYLEPYWKENLSCVEFDFGYCITCHKSQGSQWENVYVVDESNTFRENSSRWLYTALTRASENVIVYTN